MATAKPIDWKNLPAAKAVRWVREDVHLGVVAERDAAEGLLAAAERRVTELERALAGRPERRAS